MNFTKHQFRRISSSFFRDILSVYSPMENLTDLVLFTLSVIILTKYFVSIFSSNGQMCWNLFEFFYFGPINNLIYIWLCMVIINLWFIYRVLFCSYLNLLFIIFQFAHFYVGLESEESLGVHLILWHRIFSMEYGEWWLSFSTIISDCYYFIRIFLLENAIWALKMICRSWLFMYIILLYAFFF